MMKSLGEAESWDIDFLDGVLDGLEDATLVVIKGHLAIERILYAKVTAVLPKPESFDQARLSFMQLMLLAKAMFYPLRPSDPEGREDELIWDAISALNTLRNRMAHRLDVGDVEPLLRRICLTIPYDGESISDPEFVPSLHGAVSFLAAVMMMMGAFDEDTNPGDTIPDSTRTL